MDFKTTDKGLGIFRITKIGSNNPLYIASFVR
jgi:hypothetical protein